MKDIVVVGGGSSGWMTAAILIKSFPEKNISLLESDEIPKIGVGESTYDGINHYLEYLGIDRESFFNYTNATVKLAIQFRNFYKESGEPDFIYPFGAPVFSGRESSLDDWMLRKSINKTIPVTDFAESYFPAAHLVKHNRLSDNNYYGTFSQELNTALHFDAIKFAEWLKNKYCLPKNVKHIIGTIDNITTNEDGIDKLFLSDGRTIEADLFVDCTGFKSLLLDKTLKEEFISYTDILPNTKAWATQIQYKDPDIEVENVTRCTALKNGWCWNIPLFSRLGSGYVYSDKYTTDEEALKEFKNYLTSELKIPRTQEDVESLEFRNIKMRVGIHKRTWVKNVVAIGLSAGFIEPLESNGLFTVHEFLFCLVKSLKRDKISQWDRDVYNKHIKKIYDNFVEFIRLHYALSLRDDSEYWKNNFNRSYFNDPNSMSELSHLNTVADLGFRVGNRTMPQRGGNSWISVGMNYFLVDKISLTLLDIMQGPQDSQKIEDIFKKLDNNKKNWDSQALGSETSYEYIKRKYHSE